MNNTFQENSFIDENEKDLNYSSGYKTPNAFVLHEKSTPSFSPIHIRRKDLHAMDENQENSFIFPAMSPVESSSLNVNDQIRQEDDEEEEEERLEMTDEERRLKEEAESEALARQLMAEEAMASYHESSNYLMENQDQFSEEDLAALRAIMQEENPVFGGSEEEEEEEEEVSEELSYDALLRLGERIGDVKTERWKMRSKKEIEKLPLMSYCPSMGYGKCENDSDVKCLVCQFQYEGGDNVRKLPCNHYFHSECVDQWLTEKDHCPYCRQCIVVE